MEWIIQHHEAVLLWIAAISLYAAGTVQYHAPVLGAAFKLAAFVFVIAGVREAIRRER